MHGPDIKERYIFRENNGKEISRPGSSTYSYSNAISAEVIKDNDGGTLEVDCNMENVQEEDKTEFEMLSQNCSTNGKTEEHILESNRFLQKQEAKKDAESEEDNHKDNSLDDDIMPHEECINEDGAVKEESESLTQTTIPTSPKHEVTTVVSIKTDEEENNDFINDTDRKIVMKNFELFDTDNSGYICFSDLGSYARSLGMCYKYIRRRILSYFIYRDNSNR